MSINLLPFRKYHTVTPKLHIAWIYSTYGFSSLYDLINSAFLTRKALHFSYTDAHKKSRGFLGSNSLCCSRLYSTVLNDNILHLCYDTNHLLFLGMQKQSMYFYRDDKNTFTQKISNIQFVSHLYFTIFH